MDRELPTRPVTTAQLHELRRELSELGQAARVLTAWRQQVPEATLARLSILRAGSVDVLTTCALCQRAQPVTSGIDSTETPSAVICHACDALVDAGIAIEITAPSADAPH